MRFLLSSIVLLSIILGIINYSDKRDEYIQLYNRDLYDMKLIMAPVLSGSVLKAFVNIVETWPFSSLIGGKVMQDSELALPRLMVSDSKTKLGNELRNTPPTFFPRPELSTIEENFAKEKAKTLNKDIKMILSNKKGRNEYISVSNYARAYREGKIKPSEIIQRVLHSIVQSEKLQPPLRSVIKVSNELAMNEAFKSDNRFEKNTSLSLWDGVPVVVKDEFDVKGFVTSGGTTFINEPIAKTDATIVKKLRDLGAIIIGVTNMHEFGMGVTGMNPHYGFSRNPYNIEHVTGGSSSGSASAVGAGLVPVAIGADGGGSIRIPAALCGVVGLKATFGRISDHGAIALAYTVTHAGPLAATAADTALSYIAMSGFDQNDINTHNQPPVHLSTFHQVNDLKDLTIGVFDLYNNDASPTMIKATDNYISILKKLGAKIKKIEIPHLQLQSRAHAIAIMSEMATTTLRYSHEHHDKFGLDIRLSLSVARKLSASDYVASAQIRTWATKLWNNLFNDVDVIVTPATGLTAPRIHGTEQVADSYTLSKIMRFIMVPNFTGHPAITFPVELDESNLPASVQVIGRFWHEHTLLRLANVAEHHLPQVGKPQVNYAADIFNNVNV